VSSTGLHAPPGRARAGVPWRAVTVFDAALHVSRLPIGRFSPSGWQVEAPGEPYPGPATTDPSAALATLVRPSSIPDAIDDVLVLAPTGAPAARALAVLARLGDVAATLAVAVPDEQATWRGMVAAHALTWKRVTDARLRIDLGLRRVAVVGADGAVKASYAVVAAPDQAGTWAAVLGVSAGRPLEVVAALPDTIDVAALVGLADQAAIAGVTALGVTTDGATGNDQGPFTPAAATAALSQ
jgi:hypothetical protein